MPKIAYLANLFPAAVEPYVIAEIRELRRRGVEVLPCSARKVNDRSDGLKPFASETLYLQPLRWLPLSQAIWLCLQSFGHLACFVQRALVRGREPARRRLRALLHTWLGAYYAVLLRKHGIDHIHVHHGYFSSWIAMVAAQLLGIEFSVTLHGSDLLLHPAFLDLKLERCRFCSTISEYNRQFLIQHYPGVDARKLHVRRLGVDCPSQQYKPAQQPDSAPLVMLCVGRLHAVKNQDFLVRACHRLKQHRVDFQCLIAGDGPERGRLEALIRDLGLQQHVRLLGHVPHPALDDYYKATHLVVLTSRSEGIPLVLMEAMASGKIVLAPAMTGIPELVMDGETGFLYRPGSLDDFVERVLWIQSNFQELGQVRRAAREFVAEHFRFQKNLEAFCDLLLANVHLPARNVPPTEPTKESGLYENPVLQ